MSIEKYLNNIKVPINHPGPFSVKLKHELKTELFIRRRKRDRILVASSSLSIGLFAVLVFIVFNPTAASQIHDTVLVQTGLVQAGEADIQQQLAEQRQFEIDLPDEGRYLGFSHQVSQSNSANNYQIMELSELDEETPYLIRKVRGSNNRYIYLISEVENPRSGRILY